MWVVALFRNAFYSASYLLLHPTVPWMISYAGCAAYLLIRNCESWMPSQKHWPSMHFIRCERGVLTRDFLSAYIRNAFPKNIWDISCPQRKQTFSKESWLFECFQDVSEGKNYDLHFPGATPPLPLPRRHLCGLKKFFGSVRRLTDPLTLF